MQTIKNYKGKKRKSKENEKKNQTESKTGKAFSYFTTTDKYTTKLKLNCKQSTKAWSIELWITFT